MAHKKCRHKCDDIEILMNLWFLNLWTEWTDESEFCVWWQNASTQAMSHIHTLLGHRALILYQKRAHKIHKMHINKQQKNILVILHYICCDKHDTSIRLALKPNVSHKLWIGDRERRKKNTEHIIVFKANGETFQAKIREAINLCACSGNDKKYTHFFSLESFVQRMQIDRIQWEQSWL